MTAIELLLQRQSNPSLTSPAPNSQDLEQILAAGMRVPDHGCLQPWHFTLITEDKLQHFSDLLVSSSDKQADNIEKIAKMPFRAPMIIVISTDYKEHEKVPQLEQLITAGCCTHAMQMAAFALGYGAIWRTGAIASNDKVKEGLNISAKNEIVGFLYIGTPKKEHNVKPTKINRDNISYL